MSYKTVPLSKELAQIFVDYLGSLDFEHAPHWASCFCRFYYTGCSTEEWMNRTAEINRTEALKEIEAGTMKGWLAFDGEKCIGWCNANDVRQLPRLWEDAKEYCGDKRAGCTPCFVIHPEYRGRGVARQLLKAVVESFRQQGFEGMLALPFEDSEVPERRYRGTLGMYQELGYRPIDKRDRITLLWLDLQ